MTNSEQISERLHAPSLLSLAESWRAGEWSGVEDPCQHRSMLAGPSNLSVQINA